MNIDLGKFKKIKEDAHSAQMQHPDGHKIMISKKILSSKMKDEIQKLPLHLAEGTPDEPIQPDQQNSPQQQPTTVINIGQPQQAQPMASMPAAGTPPDPRMMGVHQESQMPQFPEPTAAPQITHGATGSWTPSNPPPSAIPAQQPPDLFGTQAYYDAYSKGLGEQRAGIGAEAQALGQQGQMSAKAMDEGITQQRDQMQQYQQHYQTLDQERNAFQQDLQNEHIDAKHYLNSMGTGQKIATGIGLILGGMGGGGNGNLALDFLNKQISNDIEAQKSNLGKKENLLSANMRQFGNLRDATSMTQVMQMDIVKNQLAKAAAVSQDPLAKARAQMAIGQLDQQAAPILSQMAARKILLGGQAGSNHNQGTPGGVDPSYIIKAVAPEKEQEGLDKQLQTAENMSKQRDNLMDAFEDLNQNNTIMNRVTSPLQTPKQTAAVREPLLAQLVKDSEGRITPTDVEMLRGLFPAPGDDPNTIKVKRAQMKNFLDQKMNFPALKPYGINPMNFGRHQSSGASKYTETAPNLGQ